MHYAVNHTDNVLEITMHGQFTFADNIEFKKLVALLVDAKATQVVLNFGDLQFLDSAALGMLLLLRDEAKKHGADLTIKNPRGQIDKTLTLSDFDQLFTIDRAAA